MAHPESRSTSADASTTASEAPATTDGAPATTDRGSPDAASADREPAAVGRKSLQTTAQVLRSVEVRMNLLRARGIAVPSVDLAGAYARALVARALDLTAAPEEETGYDAEDPAGVRYRIVGHRDGSGTARVTVPGIPHRRFDRIVAVRLGSGYGIRWAPLVPSEPFLRHARYGEDANEWSLSLDHEVWKRASVADLTELLRTTASESVPGDGMPAIDPFTGPPPYPSRRGERDVLPPRA